MQPDSYRTDLLGSSQVQHQSALHPLTHLHAWPAFNGLSPLTIQGLLSKSPEWNLFRPVAYMEAMVIGHFQEQPCRPAGGQGGKMGWVGARWNAPIATRWALLQLLIEAESQGRPQRGLATTAAR